MSIRINLVVLSLVVFAYVTYMVYEGLYINHVATYNEFLQSYLNNVQKYLFNITLISVSVFYIVRVPFLKPQLRIRFGSSLAYQVIVRGMVISSLITAYITFLFTFVPLSFNYGGVLSELHFDDALRLFVFIYYLYVTSIIIYAKTSNHIIGIAGTLFLNFLILITVLAVNYYVLKVGLPREVKLDYLMIGTSAFNIIGSTYLYYYLTNKECLQ